LVGAAPDNPERYQEELNVTNPSTGEPVILKGTDAYNNSYTYASFKKFQETGNPADLEIAEITPLKPETVKSFEFGYRGLIAGKMNMDFSVYYNIYNDLKITKKVVAMASEVGDVHDNTFVAGLSNEALKLMQVYTTAPDEIKSYGLDVGFDYKAGNYKIGLIYDYAKLDLEESNLSADFETKFNTPEHQIKVSLSNKNIFKDFGFKLVYKYQTEFEWQGPFHDTTIPERQVLDAQINYYFKKQKIRVKAGGSNLLGNEYMPAPGTGMIGSIYYLSLQYGG